MPSDFLLPLFVVTLLANAVLVAFAIRAIRQGPADDDRPLGNGRQPMSGGSGDLFRSPGEQAAAEPAARSAAPVAPAERPEPAPSTDGEPTAPAAPVAPTAPADPTGQPAPVASPKRRRPTRNAADGPAGRSGSAEPRRGRRRFSLPPLDDDHEKVNRSIESFLGGPDASLPEGEGVPTTGIPPTDAATGPTTVVAIAVVDLRTEREAGPDGGVPDDDLAEALAMVERTLRGAARGTDVVTVDDRGRFRIVLQTAGELAARSWLRRIRAVIEPRLQSAAESLHLAVATATSLDEPIERAVRRAEDRLALALAAARQSDRESREAALDDGADGDPDEEDDAPRAAAD